MSKIINIFNVMASVLFLTLIMACNMQVSQLLKNENLIDNNPQNQNYDSQFVKISFDLDQSIYDTRTFSKRTILPLTLLFFQVFQLMNLFLTVVKIQITDGRLMQHFIVQV